MIEIRLHGLDHFIEEIMAIIADLPPVHANQRTLLACELLRANTHLNRAKLHLPTNGCKQSGNYEAITHPCAVDGAYH